MESKEYNKASSTAEFYGFVRMPQVAIEKIDLVHAKSFREGSMKEVHPFSDTHSKFSGFFEEKIAIIRSVLEKKMSSLPQPIMVYYEGPIKGNPHIKNTSKEKTFNLEIIGNGKSMAEAIIIETAFIIAKEHYPKETLSIELNSAGDKESLTRFSKELSLYMKKHFADVPAHCKTACKKDAFEIFNCVEEKCLAFQEQAPKSMSYLSEGSRKHFMEVLEYIESLDIPYTINHRLVGSRSYCSGILFEINATSEQGKVRTIAIGERYNILAKKVWGKKEVPAIGAAIHIYPSATKISRRSVTPLKKAKFFFIQLGYDARLKSLQILETLRQAKIAVSQSLSKDKLAAQIASAEKLKIPYVIIMGQKEAMENSVVVRNMNTRSQDTILVKDLIPHLKKLK
jgi:histidyl-tRNA synthetase